MSDMRHNFVLFIVLCGGLWAVMMILMASAPYTVIELNESDYANINYSEEVPSVTGATDMIGVVLGSFIDMFSIFPVWLQAILVGMISAIAIYSAATLWTAIGG